MNSAGIGLDKKQLIKIKKECHRCGRKNHDASNCYEKDDLEGIPLNYCQCLRCQNKL